MRNHFSSVIVRTANECGFTSAKQRKTERVKAWRDDSAIVSERAFFVDEGKVKPAVIGTKSRRPYDTTNFSFSKIDRQR